MSDLEQARRAKSIHKANILVKPNVVGVGVGYRVSGQRATDELGVLVLVRRKVPLAGLAPEFTAAMVGYGILFSFATLPVLFQFL